MNVPPTCHSERPPRLPVAIMHLREGIRGGVSARAEGAGGPDRVNTRRKVTPIRGEGTQHPPLTAGTTHSCVSRTPRTMASSRRRPQLSADQGTPLSRARERGQG